MTLAKRASAASAHPGQQIAYELVASNAGPSSATDVTVTDTLPAELSLVSASPECTPSGQTVTCQLAALPAGTTRTFTVTARVADTATGELRNTATISSATPDADAADGTASHTLPIEPLADLSIDKRALADRAVPGRTLAWELTVRSAGPSTARDVVVTDRLPNGLSFVSASDACAFADGTVTCRLAELAAGRSATLRLVTRVARAHTGTITNAATVSSATTDRTRPTTAIATRPAPRPKPTSRSRRCRRSRR